MEEDIDEEINADNDQDEEEVPEPPKKQRVTCDFKSLDEMVNAQ